MGRPVPTPSLAELECVSVAEAARILGFRSPAGLRCYIRRGELRAFRPGGKGDLRITRKAIADFLASEERQFQMEVAP